MVANRWLSCIAPGALAVLAVFGCADGGEPPPPPSRAQPAAPAPAPPPEAPSAPAAAAPVDARCPGDDHGRCFDEAMARLRAGDGPSAVVLLGDACDGDHARSCFKLGALIRDGRVPARPPREGEALIERACRGGQSAACDALGH